eukprot:CAMPEP_0119336112 /NCGR_PEP_ID=MMETSP1333-20130426/91180_1 /TAXON_ID=418940 /ORGANISM="Scyphosphaera apsteinii, Strain RCC1455" /LENGTH=146 /DNA_ID=CAMNT_0007346839 /DNA_START=440 /DNA_END=880 /DNA_ORIENTATION=+
MDTLAVSLLFLVLWIILLPYMLEVLALPPFIDVEEEKLLVEVLDEHPEGCEDRDPTSNELVDNEDPRAGNRGVCEHHVNQVGGSSICHPLQTPSITQTEVEQLCRPDETWASWFPSVRTLFSWFFLIPRHSHSHTATQSSNSELML